MQNIKIEYCTLHLYLVLKLHDVTLQKEVISIVTFVRTSNLKHKEICLIEIKIYIDLQTLCIHH
jgi:hypothetical protein